jgi:hypothetical protein
MMRRILLLVGLLLTVLVSGCGGTSVTKTSIAGVRLQTTTKPVARASLPIVKKCPPGQSFMGCSTGSSPYNYTSAPAGAKFGTSFIGKDFPDVSSYQGCVINWPKIDVPGAVVKAWETGEDQCLAHNATSLNVAKKRWTMYDFVRYCSAGNFIALYNKYKPPLPPVIDEEVSAAANCTAPLAKEIHADSYNHDWPIEYNSPGTEQAGASADDLEGWFASFGAASAPREWRPAAAWQFASPPYEYVLIPGLGYGDVNRDLGMLELVVKPPEPTHPTCFPENTERGRSAYCKHDYVDKTHFEREIRRQRALLFDEFCWTAGKNTRSCKARLKRNAVIHAALERLLKTSTYQP